MFSPLAFLTMFGWPVVAILLFRQFSVQTALAITIIGGYLLLPYGLGINLPMLPTFDKTLIPALSAGILGILASRAVKEQERRRERAMRLAVAREQALSRTLRSSEKEGSAAADDPPRAARGGARGRMPGRAKPDTTAESGLMHLPSRRSERLLTLLVLLLLVTPLLTFLTNREPLANGGRLQPGLRVYDIFSMVLTQLVAILPFLLGRRFLGRPEDQGTLLKVLAIAGLLYSLPMLVEIRLSPQIAKWVYGFTPAQFATSARGGGWRPFVFLQAGLWLAIFSAMATLAALALWREGRKGGRGRSWLLAGLYLGAVLTLSHSLGALIICVLLAPLVILTTLRIQLLTAALVATVVLTYPMLRGSGLIPVDRVASFIEAHVSVDRAQSFTFRLENEDILLAKANERPMAGWGGWGRSRVIDEKGNDISVTDGQWIILIGVSGWLGYIGQFGLLTVPIVLIAWRRRQLAPSPVTAGLCLIVAANLVDMILNATLTPVTWLAAGALAGRLGYGRVEEEDPALEAQGPARPGRARPRRSASVHRPLPSRRERPILQL